MSEAQGVVPVTIIRHPRERLSKCTLTPLHERPEITFLTATENFRFDASGYTLLSVAAPPLTEADAGRPLLLLDGTWRLLEKLERTLTGTPVRRSIPAGVATAYPRVSKNYDDPVGGLASIEALFIAKRILGDEDRSLLESYRWREAFLAALAGDGEE